MPAYRQRIYICPDQNSRPCRIVEFPIWWEVDEFLQTYGDRQLDTGNPFYVDYAILLTGIEARVWDERAREQFCRDPQSNAPFFVESMRQVEIYLKAASWVIVESYEWESGLS